MDEIREGIERLVVGAALLELFLDDLEIAQPGDAGGGHDHRLGASADERHHVLLEDAQHHLGLVLNEAVVLEGHVLERLGHDPLGIELLLVRLGHDRAMQVVERLVGNDAGRHIHDVAFGDGLGLGVGVERLAEQGDGGRRRRGGERDEHLIEVVLADDLGELLLRVKLGGLGIRFVRFAERQPDGRAHLAFLRAVGFINQEGDPQFLQFGVLLDLVQHPGELLLRGDDDRLALLEEARQVVGLPRQTDDVLQVREVLDVVLDIRVERFPVGEDEHHVHQLLVRAGLEQAVQAVRQPADGQRLAAAGGMIDEILAADVALGGEVRRDVVRHLPHRAALVVAREQGEGRTLRLVVLRVALGHADEEERERFEQLVLRQHLAVEELHRVFAAVLVTASFVRPVLCQRKFCSRRGSVAAITSLVSAAR